MASQVIKQLTLAFFNAFYATKSFKMGFSYIGDQSMCRQCIGAIACYLTLVIGAHFNYSDLCIFPDL